ncbi:MAG: hypothetical protein ACP5I3_03285 [Thermoproteus sp.]|jgi:hypothetical protein
MRVVRTGLPVTELLNELRKDLQNEKLEYMQRIPAPRAGERYRDVVAELFTKYGAAAVYIMLKTPEGEKRYTVLARYDWSFGGFAEGWIVEGDTVRVFEPIGVSLGQFSATLEEFGDLFWKTEQMLASRKVEQAGREPY